MAIPLFFVDEKAPLLWQRWVLKLPWGVLKLYFSEAGIGYLVLGESLFDQQGTPPFAAAEPPWPGLASELQEFFQGRRIKGKYPLLTGGYSSWTVKVLQLTAAIPFGQTSTYGKIASAAGNPQGARAVGQALGRNNTLLLIPCHRVIGKNGTLGGFSSGLTWKRRLLALEGHIF